MVNLISLNIFYFWVGLLVFRFSLLQSNLLKVFFQNVQLHKLQHWLHCNFVRFIHLKKKEKALFVLVKLYYGYRKFC